MFTNGIKPIGWNTNRILNPYIGGTFPIILFGKKRYQYSIGHMGARAGAPHTINDRKEKLRRRNS